MTQTVNVNKTNKIKNMQKQIQDIREFQEKIVEVEEGSLFFREEEDFQRQVKLRMALLREEVDELEEALLNRDPVETLDAIVDIHYIANGTAQEAGVVDLIGKGWDLIHTNNMTKLDENGKVHKNASGKVIKPANYKPVSLEALFK